MSLKEWFKVNISNGVAVDQDEVLAEQSLAVQIPHRITKRTEIYKKIK